MAGLHSTTSFELLAPAGSPAILKAVIAAGADAAYVGGSRFGARAYAQNFSDEELCDAIDYVHLHGRKLYLTVNTLVKNTQMDELCESIRPLYERGLDAVIVQDIGVIHMLRREYPDLPVHASTQMTITGVDGVRMLGELGVSRVVLSRELSIAEMARIRKETGMELEVFVHGALCYSYSGQCLFSSMLGGRSGNRGRCAQPCRLPYQICGNCSAKGTNIGTEKDSDFAMTRKGHGSMSSVNQESYILSLKDLCGIEDLPALRDAGVYSLKIEGRMKQAAYAAGVTAYYRKYIDMLDRQSREGCCGSMAGVTVSDEMTMASRNKHSGNAASAIVGKKDLAGLLALGNRSGFTDGYYHKRNGSDMVTFEKPAYTTTQPSADSGEAAVLEHKIRISGWAYFHKGEASYLTVSTRRDIPEGFRNTPEDHAIQSNHLQRTASKSIDDIAELSVTVTVTGQAPQAAAKAPVTGEQIRQRLEKTGDTPFVFEELTVDAGEGIFIPNGELNRMRRDALAQLREEMLAPYQRQVQNMSTEEGSGLIQVPAGSEKDRMRMIASVSSLEQLEAVLADGRMTDIYLETVSYPRAQLLDILHQAIRCIKASVTSDVSEVTSSCTHTARTTDGVATNVLADKEGVPDLPRIYLALPPVFRAHTEQFYTDIADELRLLPIDGFLVRNYEEFAWAGRLFAGYPRILDANVYTYNDEASETFRECGAAGNTVPLELNRGEIFARNNRESEMVVYGYYPLMVSAQCVHANTSACDRQPGITRIRDRKGVEFPVRNFCSECVNIVYNSVPTMLFSRMDELERTGMRGFRLDFTIEDGDAVRDVLDMLSIPAITGRPEETLRRQGLRQLASEHTRRQNQAMNDLLHTNGHYTRGVE